MSAAQLSAQPGLQPTVVLVHGAFADASSWNGVIERLQQQGCTVVAPANPLRGLAPDSAYIASVVNQIDGPVLLVGHSYGGAVITSAAATATGVVGLVFVAAFAPDEGERRQRRRPFHGPARGCRHRRGRGLARDHGLPAAGGDEPDLQGGAHPDRSPGTAAMTTRGRDGC
jgi:pimeloyl-ACP methyl ester carboxylesterase